MNRDVLLSKYIFFPLLFVGVLILGAMIPTFYDWSGADQSRPSPQVTTAIYAIVGFMIAAASALPLLPTRRFAVRTELDQPEEAVKFQFNLRTLLIVTSVTAIVTAGFTSLHLIVIVWVIMLSLFFSAWFVMHDLSGRWKLVALLGCMYSPYAWVLFSKSFNNVGPVQLIAAFGLPTFAPSILIGRFFESRVDESVWPLILLTGIELAIGVWMIRLGPRRAVAWIFVVLFFSFWGSGFLNAAMRI